MSNPSYMPWIRREDYDAFRRLCPGDADFPETFDDWLKVATAYVRRDEANGRRVIKAHVEPKEFAAWCQAAGLNRNGASLNAFAIKKAGEGE